MGTASHRECVDAAEKDSPAIMPGEECRDREQTSDSCVFIPEMLGEEVG